MLNDITNQKLVIDEVGKLESITSFFQFTTGSIDL